MITELESSSLRIHNQVVKIHHILETNSKINVQMLTDICETLLEGEPVFITRAQDQDAMNAIDGYMYPVKMTSRPVESVMKRMYVLRDKFFNWKRQNPHRVKVAD